MRSFVLALVLVTIGCKPSVVVDAEKPEVGSTIVSSAETTPSTEPESRFILKDRARAAYKSGDWSACVDLYDRSTVGGFRTDISNARYNAACCAALAGNVDAAFALLDKAIETGFNDRAHLEKDEDFEGLRKDPRWEATLAKVERTPAAQNTELAEIYAADQADRTGGIDDGVMERDEARRKAVDKILAAGGATTAKDFYHAAMVFQHGTEVADYERAHELAVKAVELDPGDGAALWLSAAASDRAAMMKGVPQKYGTQYVTDPDTGIWRLYDVDPQVTDEERAAMNVPPLDAARARVERMNQD